MITNFNYNTSFGHKVPTNSLLKMGSGIFSYEDARELCYSFDKKFPGHVGYYKKAIKHSENIGQKNPNINKILSEIKAQPDKISKLKKIEEYTRQLGSEIDVVI